MQKFYSNVWYFNRDLKTQQEKDHSENMNYWNCNLDNRVDQHLKFVELCALMILILDLQAIQC